MAMTFYILNSTFDVIGVVDSYKSAIWTERFFTSGDFELYVPNSSYYSEILRLPDDGHSLYALRVDDLTKLGIIEKISYTEDPDSGDMIIASGHTDDYLLHYRLIMEQVTYIGNIEQAIRHMIRNAFISADIAGNTIRMTDKLALGPMANITGDVNLQYQGQYLNEEVDKLCQEHGFGYYMAYDYSTKSFTFNLKKSTNRSLNQHTRPPVVFSGRMDNISSREYDKELPITAAYAYGEGNGSFKYSSDYSLPAFDEYPLERRECYVDAQKTSNNGEAMIGIVLKNLLKKEARAMVRRAQNKNEKVVADILPGVNYVLGVDYDLGDIIQFIIECGDDRSLIRSFKQRVTEVIECFDENGYSCIPTFETVTN